MIYYPCFILLFYERGVPMPYKNPDRETKIQNEMNDLLETSRSAYKIPDRKSVV